MFLITSITLFLLTACSQEALVAPESAANSMQQPPSNFLQTISIEHPTASSATDTTLQLQVGEVTISTANGELSIEFTGNYDFSGVIPENTQHLKFEDVQNVLSTFSFDINNYLGENGRFEVDFDLGGNDLTGLELTPTQVVGIEDIISY